MVLIGEHTPAENPFNKPEQPPNPPK